MTLSSRRAFLKHGAVVLSLAGWPSVIRQALAVPPAYRSGTIMDVEHVVIFMQENRSFDHYFGSLRGVRGFSDPRPIVLPSGETVWRQPGEAQSIATPFHLDTKATSAQWLKSLDHSWKGSQEAWKHYDNWIAAKGPMTMGYFQRDDIPFYYALADAFTICDAYHCSIFGPTNPNRMYLFTGTNGLAVGNDGLQAVVNSAEEVNETADQANDSKTFQPYRWTTYAERLGAAGVDWRVYQEYDNYGDNALSYFDRFRGLDPASDDYLRARSWPAESAGNKDSKGDYLVKAFASDVAAGKLPQVSWIVAPKLACEHPDSCPAFGQAVSAGLIAALASHPEVWAKTVLFLNYDENDGFFDHVPPPVPAISSDMGKSLVGVEGEIYGQEPVGLGPRVPMLVISPWSRGGFVNSQLFDHTSVIQFLEKRFGVSEPNITPWRRAVCGDLTSAFDFSHPAEGSVDGLPETTSYSQAALTEERLPSPQARREPHPVQEPGQRPARALPYALEVSGEVRDEFFRLDFVNLGAVAAVFTVYAPQGRGPWSYTVGAGQSVSDQYPVSEKYDFQVHGPNGFLRAFQDRAPFGQLTTEATYDGQAGELVLGIQNIGAEALDILTRPLRYSLESERHHLLRPGARLEDRWTIVASDNWYDIELRCRSLARRWAGHTETGKVSRSDPALGMA